MADSDDEYDRKRRDKFRGERSAGGSGADSYRSERRDDRRGGGAAGRDEWPERNPFRGGAGAGRPRPDYRDYRGPRDRYGSPGRDLPPAKRMRGDWGDELGRGPRYPPYDPYLMHAWNEHYAHSLHAPYSHGYAHRAHEPAVAADTQTQPAMLTLKQFLETQDDGISDSEVMKKYTDYKLEFKRQQLNEFFVAHKDEEWFKNKYHPVDSVRRKEEQLGFLQKRVEVFNEVLQNGQIKSVSVDTTQTDGLLRVLDTVVIKLEGGTEEDLKILDEKPKEIVINERLAIKKPEANDDDVIITSVEKQKEEDTTEALVVSPRPLIKTAGSDEENWDEDEDVTAAKPAVVEPIKKKKREKKNLKRKRKNTDSSSSSSSSETETTHSSSSSEAEQEEEEEDEDDETVNKKYDLSTEKVTNEPAVSVAANESKPASPVDTNASEAAAAEIKAETTKEQEIEATTTNEQIDAITAMQTNENELSAATTNGNAAATTNEEAAEAITALSADTETAENPTTKDKTAEDIEDIKKSDENAANEPETIDLDNVKDTTQPRALHRTSSIFLRNLAPAITKADIEAVCKGFDGFLRVAIADPSVERRWYRRGWVTFKRDVNIKEICWNLNNTRLRDCEMGAIVNRDLSRRVRPVNGMTAHKTIVRSDIKLCAKIALNLDEKFRLWCSENAANAEQNGGTETSNSGYGFKSNNPVLQNITDFLIEEASAEEEELLGISGENKDNENADGLDRDSQLISVLDSLILYLRIVHSVDFYNHCEYPYEDEMPNRCGIIHARGPAPSKINPNDMQDYIKNFEGKMQTFLAKTTTVEEEELKNLGCKDAEAEVEKFVQANTQELAKDKWLCPLSGKKFKGPEFIRKHIFNKHAEKVEEVRKEVEYFNNYLKDPKRPQLPEHPGSTKRTNSESSAGGGYRPPYAPAYAPPYAPYAPLMMPPRGARGFGGPPPRRELPLEHQRRIVGYHDLDAPANFDVFD